MWRQRILTVLAVAALGVSACWVVTRGGHDVGPCASDREWYFGDGVDEDFYRSYIPRLDVDIGETVKLKLTIRKNRDDSGRFVPEPGVSFVVTGMPDTGCSVLWRLPFSASDATRLPSGPGEVVEYEGEWTFVDRWGVLVPPDEYVLHAVVHVRDETNVRGSGSMAAFERINMGNDELNAARPKHPPVPVAPSACGSPAGSPRAERTLSEHGDALRAMISDGGYDAYIFSAPLLDERRVPTGRYGIRVTTQTPLEDSLLRSLPECLGGVPLGVPVQVVVRPED